MVPKPLSKSNATSFNATEVFGFEKEDEYFEILEMLRNGKVK